MNDHAGSLRRGLIAFAAVALAAGLFLGTGGLAGAPHAAAQGVPTQTCNGVVIGGSGGCSPNCGNSTGQPNGVASRLCGSGLVDCGNGVYVQVEPCPTQPPQTQACTTCFAPQLLTCAGGQQVAAGQTCPSTSLYQTCANGQPVPFGLGCAAPQFNTYPQYGGPSQYNPTQYGSLQYSACPGGQMVPLGQLCPGAQTQVIAAQPAVTSTTSSSAAVPLNLTFAPSSQPAATSLAAPGSVSVSYAPGWNLVAGPPGTVIPSGSTALFTLQAGDTSYEQSGAGSPLQSGDGYWAYFSSAATVSLPPAGAGSRSVSLPAGQWVMIGNPGSTSATVSGADTVLVYDPVGGYRPTTQLNPGQGAWAESAAGGAALIANSAS